MQLKNIIAALAATATLVSAAAVGPIADSGSDADFISYARQNLGPYYRWENWPGRNKSRTRTSGYSYGRGRGRGHGRGRHETGASTPDPTSSASATETSAAPVPSDVSSSPSSSSSSFGTGVTSSLRPTGTQGFFPPNGEGWPPLPPSTGSSFRPTGVFPSGTAVTPSGTSIGLPSGSESVTVPAVRPSQSASPEDDDDNSDDDDDSDVPTATSVDPRPTSTTVSYLTITITAIADEPAAPTESI